MPEAVALLQRSAGTPDERPAIAAVARSLAHGSLPAEIASRCASMLAARGERTEALRFLDRASLPPELLLKADLLQETGRLPEAVCLVERVMARDVDYPGARERHARWRAALGGPRLSRRGRDDVTIAVPAGQDAPFRILREVARGGSGAVYEARDEIIGRPVAYKVYHRLQEDRAQCEREARTAVALRGPGIVRVYDASFEAGWLALEWVERGSVRDLLSGPSLELLLPVRRWAGPLARALARVHASNLVHADVKPANVLLRAPEEPILCDFGIATPVGEVCQGGSAGYMSPERLAGQPLSVAEDIYGFGRILEDVLAAAPSARDDALVALMRRCLGPPGDRPAAPALATELESWA